jgi:DMSO/TMAO reductase YedYZ heme-binding membrane subunit
MTPKIWWFVARSSGLVAWWLCGLSIVVGLVLAGRLRRQPAAAWQQDLHRFLGGLGALCLGVHLVGLALDPTVAFGPSALTIPMASRWRPGPVTWGIVAADALILVEVTSLLSRRMPRRVWRTIHGAGFAVWIAGTVHAWTAGTDAAVVRLTALVGSALIANLTVWRVVGRRMPRARPAGPAATVTRTRVPRPIPGE